MKFLKLIGYIILSLKHVYTTITILRSAKLTNEHAFKMHLGQKICPNIIKTRVLRSNQLTNLAQNDRHIAGVNSLIYSKEKNLFVSGSYDAYIGRWDQEINPDTRFLTNPLFPMNTIIDGQSFRAQVTKMAGTDYGQKFYSIVNLMGRRLVLYSYSEGEEFSKLNEIPFNGGTYIQPGGLVAIPNSNTAIISSSNEIMKIQIDSKESDPIKRSVTYEFSTKYLELINENQFVAYTTDKNAKQEIKRFNISNLLVDESVDTDSSISLIKILKGVFDKSLSESEAENLQKACAIFKSSKFSVDIMKNCANFSQGIRHTYKKVHGYYSINSFIQMEGTPYVFTGAGDGFVRFWNIIDTSVEIPISEIEIEYKATVYELVYLRDSNRIYVAKNYEANKAMSPSPIESFNACLVENCILCKNIQSKCEACKTGFFVQTEEGGSKCIDCSNEPSSKICLQNVRPWRLVEQDVISPNSNGVVLDMYRNEVTMKHSSKLFKLFVQDIMGIWVNVTGKSDLYPPPVEELPGKFRVTIEDVDLASYNYTLLIHDSSIYLAFNFSSDFNNKKLIFEVIDPILVKTIDPSKTLVLINRTETLTISGRETVNPRTLKNFGTAGKVAGTIFTFVGLVTAGLAAFNVCVPFGAGSFLLSFFQVIEITSRLTYINVNFGLILNALFEGLENAIGLPEVNLNIFGIDGATYFINSRGKLTFYEVEPLVISTIPYFSIFYTVFFPLILSIIFIGYMGNLLFREEINPKENGN